MGNEQTHP